MTHSHIQRVSLVNLGDHNHTMKRVAHMVLQIVNLTNTVTIEILMMVRTMLIIAILLEVLFK